jgi:hypothetical protein
MAKEIEREVPGIIDGERDGDIEALLFLLMEQAIADANADLKQVMDELRRRNERLARLRRTLAGLTAWREAHTSADSDAVRAAKDLARDFLRNTTEISDLMQLQLQTMMDRRSKMLEMISNLLKKQSDTAACILKNLK